MTTKEEIVANWLPRYTGRKLEDFGEYIILTNFDEYVELFAKKYNTTPIGYDKPMLSASHEHITIINFGIGSPNAALIMDLLSAIRPKAALFAGKCGGVKKKNNIGDYILPIAAIRAEGTSDDYMPKIVPALPAFNLQKAISTTIRDMERDYWTGTVFTTNRRVWEYDEEFKNTLRKTRVMGIDMETATIFVAGFANQIPTGALLLVTDQPMVPHGVKTSEQDEQTKKSFSEEHLEISIKSLEQLINKGITVKHLKFDYTTDFNFNKQ